MNTLIVYYSLGGNTRKIAELLRRELGADIQELRPAVPYTGSYEAIVDQGREEVARGHAPALLPLDRDPADYGAVVLGTPVWWYTFAPAVKTFLSRYDLTGKTVYPFVTNGGWIGHTERDLAAACPGAVVERCVDIKFDGDRLATPEESVRRWAARIR